MQLLASSCKTYGRIGQGVTIKNKDKNYSKFSMISAIGENGRMVYDLKSGSYKAVDVVGFLRKLIKGTSKKALVIWDGATCHTAEEIKEFLNTDLGQKLWVAKTPAYCPELNASEQVWNYLKNVQLKNTLCKTIKILKEKTLTKLKELSQDKKIIKKFFKHSKVGFHDVC